MSNKYAGPNRLFFARNMVENDIALSAGTDITIANTQWISNQPFRILSGVVNKNSNMMVRRLGLFSNFADGLVFTSQPYRVDFTIVVAAISVGAAITGGITFTLGSRTVTSPSGIFGGGGEIDTNGFFKVGNEYYKIQDVADANNATLSDNAYVNGNQACNIISTLDSDGFIYQHLPVLNCMADVDEFIVPSARLSGISGLDDLIFLANVNPLHSITFATDGINSAYDTTIVTFDVGMELEYTSANPDLS